MPFGESGVAGVAEVPLTEAILADMEWFNLLGVQCEPLLLIGRIRVDQVSELNWEFEYGREVCCGCGNCDTLILRCCACWKHCVLCEVAWSLHGLMLRVVFRCCSEMDL